MPLMKLDTVLLTVCLTWLTEQSLREIYLKGFEIAIKGGVGDNMTNNYFETTKPLSQFLS